MKTFALPLTALAIALTLTACNSAPDTHAADVKAIKDTEAQWNQDFASKDLTKVVSHYTDDAVMMTTGSPAVSGKEGIESALKAMVADPALSLHFVASQVEVAKSGELGYTRGSYTLDVTDPVSKKVVHDHGSYMTTFRKGADGSWKADNDIVSSAVRPAAPMPEPKKKQHKKKK